MRGLQTTTDGGPGGPSRLTLRAYVSALHGWGIAYPPKWPVHLELRDPGLLAVVRPRRMRSQDVVVLKLTDVELRVNATQYSREGGFAGGGVGIRGAAKGMAVAGALNHMSRRRWETTHLHIIESHPTGATRSISLAFVVHTPISLLELLRPATDSWAGEWVRATIAGEIQPFSDVDDLASVYQQIETITQRQLLSPEQAQTLASHHSQPLLAAVQNRLLAHDVDHDEAQQMSRELDGLLADHRITRQQADPLRALISEIPTPEIQAENEVAREQLISELIELRRTGAITEQELQAEAARLRRA